MSKKLTKLKYSFFLFIFFMDACIHVTSIHRTDEFSRIARSSITSRFPVGTFHSNNHHLVISRSYLLTFHFITLSGKVPSPSPTSTQVSSFLPSITVSSQTHSSSETFCVGILYPDTTVKSHSVCWWRPLQSIRNLLFVSLSPASVLHSGSPELSFCFLPWLKSILPHLPVIPSHRAL